MKRIALTWASVLVVFGLCQGITAQKPQMTPAQEWMVIQEGDELRLECQGEGEIHFSTLTTMSEVDGSEYTILKNEASGTDTFVRSRTIREDTGWYACAEKGVIIWNDETILDHESNDIAWIYVYVNSTEPFVVDASFALLTAVAGDTLVVPCRTTSPALASSVRAEINWGMTDLPENMTYDPKIGFILRNVSRQLSTQAFDCLIDEPKEASASYTLHVIDSPELPQPMINQDQIRHVVWGGTMIVDCEVTVTNGQKFTMSWIVPKSIPSESWSFSTSDRKEPNGQSTWKAVLIVKNVEETDAGEYTCRAENPLNYSDAKAVIKVWTQPLVHIETVKQYYAPGKLATFTCHTAGQPVPNITWIIKEYSNMTSKEDVHLRYPSNATFQPGPTGPYHLMSTVKVEINQSGDVVCRSCNNINCVESTEPIFVSDVARGFGIIDPGVVEGDDVSVTCGASVHKYTDRISWHRGFSIHELTTTSIHVTERKSKFTWQSILEIRNVRKSDGGIYVCEALTNEGTIARTEYQLIVQDAKFPKIDDKHINQLLIPVDFGDENQRSLPLECFAEGRPTPQVSWYKNDQLLEENNQYRFSENNRKLLITYFLDGDSGRYTCAARNRVGRAEKHVDIKIIGYNSSDTSCGPHVIQSKCSEPIEVEFTQAIGKAGRD